MFSTLRLNFQVPGLDPEALHRAYSEGIADYISRDLFKTILHDEEEHIDWLETQLSLVKDVGAERYLQSRMGS